MAKLYRCDFCQKEVDSSTLHAIDRQPEGWISLTVRHDKLTDEYFDFCNEDCAVGALHGMIENRAQKPV